MEKYKATSNGEVKSEKERAVDNNANNIKNLAEVAKNAPHPYVKAAGHAVSALDKITGGKSTKALSKVATKGIQNSPGGKMTQGMLNRASESGASDAVGKVASMKNGQNPQNKSEIDVMKDGKDKYTGNNSRFSGLKSSVNKATSTNGDLIGNLWSKLPPSIKIKVVVGCGVCLLFLLMVTTIFAADDNHNLSLTNGTSISGSNVGSRKCSAEEIENKLLYVGDSRTVGMQSSVDNENVSYIAEVGKGYDWFNSTALPSIESKLQEKSDAVVVLSLGVNDLYNIDNYISAYKALIAKYPSNTFYVLSVNPVDESKTTSNGYTVTNADIEVFNKKLADNFPNNYIDSYSSLTSIGTSDGLHYDNETYKSLNNIVTSNISSSGKVMCGASGSIGDISDDLLDGGNGQIMSGGKTLISILGENEFNSLNENIKNNVNAVGYGTGLAPATAATTLIQSLLDKNIIIPYFWGGGHGTISTGANGNWGGYEYVGAGGHSTSFSRQPSGLDCSGFVSWALYNGGCKNFYPILADDFKNYGSSLSINEAKVGDIAASNSHVVLILENRGDKLLVAEAKGTAYGVIFSERSSSGLNGYKIVDMENYYQKNCS